MVDTCSSPTSLHWNILLLRSMQHCSAPAVREAVQAVPAGAVSANEAQPAAAVCHNVQAHWALARLPGCHVGIAQRRSPQPQRCWYRACRSGTNSKAQNMRFSSARLFTIPADLHMHFRKAAVLHQQARSLLLCCPAECVAGLFPSDEAAAASARSLCSGTRMSLFMLCSSSVL